MVPGDHLRQFMLRAHAHGMTEGEYAFVTTEIFHSEVWGDFSWYRGECASEVWGNFSWYIGFVEA